MTVRRLLAAAAAVTAALAGPSTIRGAAPAPVPVIVELFTSEGCSSCPPADSLLTELIEKQPIPGALVIGLSEHVDYWDSLGWKDPFSNALFTRRQSAYASALKSADVYTPQMVVNGSQAFIGSDRDAALTTIRRAQTARPIVIGLTCTASGDVDTTVEAHAANAGDLVYLAVTEDGLSTSVKNGENAGHTLAHNGVTRRLIRLGAVKPDGSFHDSRRIELDRGWKISNLHAVVFVQHGDASAIVGSQITGLIAKPRA